MPRSPNGLIEECPMYWFYYFDKAEGKDECNFHLMSETRAKEIRFKARLDTK